MSINEFASQLRKINGLYLFKIFSRYTVIRTIDNLFNYLAQKESEEDLRELERLWDLFIQTGSIHNEKRQSSETQTEDE